MIGLIIVIVLAVIIGLMLWGSVPSKPKRERLTDLLEIDQQGNIYPVDEE